MAQHAFTKMHGLGNDFVVFDARSRALSVSSDQARRIADRHLGIGCDQLIVIEKPPNGGSAPGAAADAFMRIRNADGGEVAACGNAARCVAALLMRESGRHEARIQTLAGVLQAQDAAGGTVAVDMGEPKFGWRDIPLAHEQDTLHVKLSVGPLSDPCAVSMGNPHAVFFVPDADEAEVATFGPLLENDPLFPERANIGFADVIARDRIRLRVWERGAGLTLACGTGACAALVAASRRGLADRAAEMILDGGALRVEWRADGHVVMSGPVAVAFTGTVELA